jgi:hypothetical protein
VIVNVPALAQEVKNKNTTNTRFSARAHFIEGTVVAARPPEQIENASIADPFALVTRTLSPALLTSCFMMSPIPLALVIY